MRKFLTLLITGLVLFGFGCKKDITKNDPINPENPTAWQQNISPTFDWNMWKDVTVSLTNTKNKIIIITTVDGEGQFAKLVGTNDSYQMTFRMPKITEQISINGNIVNIQNSTVNFALPSDYKSVAKAKWALNFDAASNDYIAAGNPGIVSYPFTMEAWFKTSGYTSDMAIMGLCSSTDDKYQFGVYVSQSDGKLNIRAKKDILNEEAKGTKVVTDDNWHHVAVVFENLNKRILYVDGVAEITQNADSPLLVSEVNSFTIGCWGDLVPDSYFNGLIDEVRLWNTVRLPWQISNFRTISIQNPYTGMAGYWPMEEGTGTQTINNIGNGMINLTAPDWVGDIDTDEDGIPNFYDDYPHDPLRAFNNYWPAATAGATLAFEDLWPSMGDYDMNDAVINYRFNNVTNANNKLVESFCAFQLRANGASLNAGFGFSLPNNTVAANQFQLSGHQLSELFINLNSNGSEAEQNDLTFIARDKLPILGNTIKGIYHGTYNFTLKLTINNGGDYEVNAFDFPNWNPFVLVYHSSYVNKRGHEIHLPGYKHSAKVDIELFDSINDGSKYPLSEGGTLWYKTNAKAIMFGDSVGQYFPWGLDIPGSFNWTIEANTTHNPPTTYRHTIWWGYKKFKQWAGSNGTEALDWYSGIGASYRDEDFIYSH